MSVDPTYSFLPWLRQGIANNILNNDGDASVHLRAKVNVRLKVEGSNPTGASIPAAYVDKNIQLYGPGDVVGIDKKVIIKCEPNNWITNFEPNYLPYIDFYEEDFPWRYTPAKATGERLKPWLTLVVLEDREFEDGKNSNQKPLPYFLLKSGVNTTAVFPRADELWAWAHVHFNTELPDKPDVSAEVSQLIAKSPDMAYSRILCPRKLKPNVGYHAFLIPSFESGRLSGLGLELPDNLAATQIAWHDPNTCEFPFYHRWYFRTGAVGDFEYLVSLLTPKPADRTVGYRAMDVLHPGANLSPVSNPELAGILRLGGALRVPTYTLRPADKLLLQKEDNWRTLYPEKFPQDMANRINLADDYSDEQKTVRDWNELAGIRIKDQSAAEWAEGVRIDVADEVDPDPVVTSPLYGQWHALQKRLLNNRDGSAIQYPKNWIHELNLDPRYRVAAGVGTKVVQKNQELYMQAAWEQVGDIMEANRMILFGQLAKEVTAQLFNKKIMPHINESSFMIAAPVLTRVLWDKVTVNYKLEHTTLPLAATSPAFRKLINPKSVLSKKNGNVSGNMLMGKLGSKDLVVDTPILEPSGALLLERTLNLIKRKDLKGVDFSNINRYKDLIIGPQDIKIPLIVKDVPIFSPVLSKDTVKITRKVNELIKKDKIKVVTDASGRIAKPEPQLDRIKPIATRLTDAQINMLKPQVTKIDQVLLAPNVEEMVKTLPTNPHFTVVDPGLAVQLKPGRGEAIEALRFKEALKDSLITTQPMFVEQVREKPNVVQLVNHIVKELNPYITIPKYVLEQIKIPAYIAPVFKETFTPVMAYPVIDVPMYKPLSDLSKEYFLPNIDKIEENSITLLENNQKFIEAYMVGVNHEMSRELLWREYPTDQRGSYFRQFWEVNSHVALDNSNPALRDALRDIPPIHQWSKLNNAPLYSGAGAPLKYELGTHNMRSSDGKAAVVLVIRGELLKKYPNTVVYAHKATWGIKNGQPDVNVDRELIDLDAAELANPPKSKILIPLFEAKVEPDIYFFGFDLDTAAAVGTQRPTAVTDDAGWFFVLKERPGEPRFGLDEDKADRILNWNNLSWKDIGTVDGSCIQLNRTVSLQTATNAEQQRQVNEQDIQVDRWAADTDAAELAYMLYQVPVLVAVHATRLLPK